MTSEAQIRANRKNAKKSRGPTSKSGKEISSRNATKHGLTGAKLLISGENAAEFEDFEDQILIKIQPEGPEETALVYYLAGLIWRLRRVPNFEAALHDYNVRKSEDSRLRISSFPAFGGLESFGSQKNEGVGDALNHLLSSDAFHKLCRYEAHILRQIEKVRHELERMISTRKSASGSNLSLGR